jgi:hypothetical protein
VPAVTLAPGEERERCLYLPGQNTEEAWIRRIELVARDGLHHALVAKATEERTDEIDCFGLPEIEMDDYRNVPEPIFGSSTQVTQEVVELPDGVAVPLPAAQPLVVDYHLINTTDADQQGELWINLEFMDSSEEPEPARLYAMSAIVNIAIPAQGTQTLTTTCTFPADANLLSLTPHMHSRGRAFSASLLGDVETPLLDTTRWENPETTWFQPEVAVRAGDALRFSCSWENDGDTDVGFGASADDEMCVTFGYHWPADDLLWRADYDADACTSTSGP